MPRLRFFGSFRSYVSSREVYLTAGSVREALAQIWAGNPKLRAAMQDGETMRPYVRMVVNGRQVELAQDLDMSLSPEDEVAIFSPVAGGSSFSLFPSENLSKHDAESATFHYLPG